MKTAVSFCALFVFCVCANSLAAWSTPQLLSELNRSDTERASHPCLSRDGLTIYFSRYDPVSGYRRIYEASRITADGVFVEERMLDELVSTGLNLTEPWISADGLRLYYIEVAATGPAQAKMAQRESTSHAWIPVRVLNELHLNNADVARPSLTEDELTIVFGSTRIGGMGAADVWMAVRTSRDGSFGNIRPLYEINTNDGDSWPCIMPDGLGIYFCSFNRGDDELQNLYWASRTSIIGNFGSVERIPIPRPSAEIRPFHSYVTPDGKTIFFNIAGGSIYVTRFSEQSGVFHVDQVRGSNDNDGLSRASALKSIQAGVDRTADGSTVLVWPGTYDEQVNFRGKAITVQSAADAAIVRAVSGYAFSFHTGETAASVLKNLVIRDSEYGIFLTNGSSPTLSHLTIVNNSYGISAYDGANPDISNCILWDNTYGDIFECGARYSCVQSGAEGEGNIQDYPMFADAAAGDYHLRSERGRYAPPDPTLPEYGDPINLPELNDGTNNALSPCLSTDGLTIYFTRYIPAHGHMCIVEAYRDFPQGPFTSQRVVAELAPGRDLTAPWISQDGLRLYYRDVKIRVAQRASKSSPWTYVRTLDELHSGEEIANKPSLTADELTIVFHSSRPGGAGQNDIWMATRNSTNAQFGNIRPLHEINTAAREQSPYISPDGLTLYFTGIDRTEQSGWHIYAVERVSLDELFGCPRLITYGSSDLQAAEPYLTPDNRTIFFANGSANGTYFSQANRGQWVLDVITSPCIDAGDPHAHPSGEPMPNGGRINMGAYGGTSSASMSEWPLEGDINRDGIVNLADLAIMAREWLYRLPWRP